ncbi:hypothetical protein AB3S75_043162 [Citrus x aurantiifolia]
MIFNTTQMPSTRTIVSATASTTATFMVIRSIARDYLPREVQSYFALKLRDFISSFSNELTFVIVKSIAEAAVLA